MTWTVDPSDFFLCLHLKKGDLGILPSKGDADPLGLGQGYSGLSMNSMEDYKELPLETLSQWSPAFMNKNL